MVEFQIPNPPVSGGRRQIGVTRLVATLDLLRPYVVPHQVFESLPVSSNAVGPRGHGSSCSAALLNQADKKGA